jgi:putative ABC transport system permease protein
MSIDGPVLLFTIGLAVVTSVLSGLLPVLHVVRGVRGGPGIREGIGTSGPSHNRLGRVLIVGEVALALMLLVGASLFVQSFRNLLTADAGFDTSRILTLNVETTPDDEPTASAALRTRDLVERLRALPGVTHAAAANLMPLRDAGVRGIVMADHMRDRPNESPAVAIGGVTAEFFRVLNVAIAKGRMFTDAEGRARSAVAVVNRTLAERLWPGEEAIGRRFAWSAPAAEVGFTVVGVSDDILTWDLSNRPVATAYVPYAFVPVSEPTLFLRTSGDPMRLARPARAAVLAADPTLPILQVSTMTEVQLAALSRNRTLASTFVVLGALALVLGATGVYGVVSSFVSQRTHEMGIRAALGADRRRLIGHVVRQGLSATLVGVALGLGGSVAVARLLRAQLLDVSATDPLSFVGVATLLVMTGLLASYVPARRAAGVDPLTAIRD